MKLAALLLLLLTVSGCATAYQSTSFTGGHSEKQLEKNIWRVAFHGNGYTNKETVQTYWLYRCAQMTIEKGFDGFEIISRIQLVMPMTPEQFFGSPDPVRKTSAIVVPMVIPMNDVPKPSIEADILLLRKPFEPNPPVVFDARELKQTLEVYVNGNKCEMGNICPHVHKYLYPKSKFEEAL